MATNFDRRRLLGGGCALLALGCGVEPASDPRAATHSAGSTPLEPDTGAAPDDPDAPTVRGYPCDQDEVPDATWTELPLADWPDLAAPGGWYGVTVGGRELVVAHVVEGCFAAVERACTHQGAAIDYRPDRFEFVCPRHGAVFGPDGSKVSGPAPFGVRNHPCVRAGDAVFVRVP